MKDTSIEFALNAKRRKLAKIKGFEFESVQESAIRVKRSPSRVSHLAQEGKIPGAIKVGGRWLIPQSWVIKKKVKKKRVRKKKPDIILKDPSKKVGRRKKKEDFDFSLYDRGIIN